MDRSRSLLWTAFALILMALLRASAALAAAPGYEVVELGSGSPVDVNSSGTVIGLDGTATLLAGTTGGLPIAVIDTLDGPEVLLNYGVPTFLSSPAAVYFSDSRSFLYNTIDGLVDLAAEYGRVSVPGAFFPAADMTPSGRILLSRGMILEPDGSVTPSPGKRTTS